MNVEINKKPEGFRDAFNVPNGRIFRGLYIEGSGSDLVGVESTFMRVKWVNGGSDSCLDFERNVLTGWGNVKPLEYYSPEQVKLVITL